MSFRNAPVQRELVFCHRCDNEFWRHEHGLQCPQCQSDFTEVIENNSDPRALSETPEPPPHPFLGMFQPPLPPHPIHPSHPFNDHSSWGAPDPDEGDIRQFEYHSPNGENHFSFRTTVITSNNNGGVTRRTVRSGGAGPPFHPFSMFNQPNMNMPDHMERDHRGIRESNQEHQQPRHFHASFGGPGMMFATMGAPGQTGARGDIGGPDIQRMMAEIFSAVTGRAAAGMQGDLRGPHPGMPPTFTQLFGGLVGSDAIFGDGVTSDEALDRVITQLMEQHQSGNAPGPASAAAIDALPKLPATLQDLGDDGKADCAICMDEVTPGIEITKLPCSHWYHPECVKFWLKEHDTCPVCRSGITPKEGSRNEVRQPSQAPLHNEDPVHVARRQSGSRQNPFIVPESPSRERRQPTLNRFNSGNELDSVHESVEGSSSQGLGDGILNRVRTFFAGNGSSSQNNSQSSHQPGHSSP